MLLVGLRLLSGLPLLQCLSLPASAAWLLAGEVAPLLLFSSMLPNLEVLSWAALCKGGCVATFYLAIFLMVVRCWQECLAMAIAGICDCHCLPQK